MNHLRNKTFDAVIFDLDGTLLDSMWMWEQIDIDFLSGYGIPLPPDLQKQIEGKSFSETAVYFKQRFSLPEGLEEIKAVWNEMAVDFYRTKTPLKPGAKEFLKQMESRGISMGIATSNSRQLVEAALMGNKITSYFQSVTTACEVNAGKPAPDIYLKVAKDLKADPGRCLVFEDVPAGVMAGKRAGMTVIAVQDPYCMAARDEMEAIADGYIEDYYEWMDLWKRHH